jgi:hypothetical protein
VTAGGRGVALPIALCYTMAKPWDHLWIGAIADPCCSARSLIVAGRQISRLSRKQQISTLSRKQMVKPDHAAQADTRFDCPT